MRAVRIIGLIIVGGILGFIFKSISYPVKEQIVDRDQKQIKSTKTAKRIAFPAVNKTRKKKGESKKS